jgi:hypothetical protein
VIANLLKPDYQLAGREKDYEKSSTLPDTGKSAAQNAIVKPAWKS